MTIHRPVARWPLAVISLPAAVAIWSGWVSLGSLCGFGLVEPLPGIVSFHLNTAITLPVGIEAYGAYALGCWLTPGTPAVASKFARRSAIGALMLGMLGQVAYHLLAAAHAVRAPWPVVVMVSCIPVVTLGFGAGLTHLLRAGDDEPGLSADRAVSLSGDMSPAAVQPGPQTATETGAEALGQTGTPALGETVRKALPGSGSDMSVRASTNRSVRRKPNRSASRATDRDAEQEFAAEIAAGEVPTLYQIRQRLHVGNERAKVLRQHIARQALAA